MTEVVNLAIFWWIDECVGQIACADGYRRSSSCCRWGLILWIWIQKPVPHSLFKVGMQWEPQQTFYGHFPSPQDAILNLKGRFCGQLDFKTHKWQQHDFVHIVLSWQRKRETRVGREAPAIMLAAGRALCRPRCPVWQAASVSEPLMASDVSRSGTRVVLIPVWPRW